MDDVEENAVDAAVVAAAEYAAVAEEEDAAAENDSAVVAAVAEIVAVVNCLRLGTTSAPAERQLDAQLHEAAIASAAAFPALANGTMQPCD